MRSIAAVCLILAGLMLGSPATAQDSPFVSPERWRVLTGELSGDIAYDHLRHLTLHHSPEGGSRGFQAKMRWIEAKARELGIEEVRMITDLKYRGIGWTAKSAELWIVSPDARRLASFAEAAVSIADYSRSGTWEGELVDVGAGARDSDYEGKDVKGKIVLVSGAPASAMEQAVWKRGALGVVYYNAARGVSYPDQIAWSRLSENPPKDKQNTFAFSISYRNGMELKQRLAPRPAPGPVPGSFGEGTVPGEKIVLRAQVEVEIDEKPSNWLLEGWIRGTDRTAPAILLTAHAQEEKTSANDDNSGCANLLEIGRTLAKLIKEGKIARPRRDIRFWWLNEFNSQYEYLAQYPDERKKLLVNINQDMVGARQSAGSRIQHITRTPHSLPSYLNDVMESIATLVMQANSAYLSAAQAGTRTPYSKPILSKLGTRERYGAEIVPYFDSTDHHVFNEAIIGVPGVTLTNWPDDFIHSSDDDLWQMDATQLQRNAFIVSAAALYLANVESKDVPQLAARIRTSAMRSLIEAFARGTELISLAAPEKRPEAYRDADSMLAQAVARGVAAIESLRALSPDAATAATLATLTANLQDSEGPYMGGALAEHYKLITGQSPPPTSPNEDESKFAARIPQMATASVADYYEKRNKIDNKAGASLHGLMKYEALNFVDGKRSYLAIYRAVRAEAQLAGDWYYGNVTLKDVADYLDAAVKAGVLKVKAP